MVLGSLGLYSDFSIDTKIPTGFMPGAAGDIENLAKESFAALKSNRVGTKLFSIRRLLCSLLHNSILGSYTFPSWC